MVLRFYNIIQKDLGNHDFDPKIVCLGTRSGTEIDLFRIVFLKNTILNYILKFFNEINKKTIIFTKYLFFIGRKKISFKSNQYSYGVEINPDALRKDVLISNFDFLPKSWDKKFNIIFSNSFDHSMDPINTSKNWIKLSEGQTTYFIICFTNTTPTKTDPTGYITLDDITSLFPGEVIYHSDKYSYEEVIIKYSTN